MKKVLSIILILAVFCLSGCTSTNSQVLDASQVKDLCSSIIDVALLGLDSDDLTDDCIEDLQNIDPVVKAFNGYTIFIYSLLEDNRYICVCQIQLASDAGDNVVVLPYRISFSYDNLKNKVTEAEVISYADI